MSTPVALLLGSSRTNGNAAGLSAWVTSIFNKAVAPTPDAPSSTAISIAIIDPHAAPHPLGPVTDPVMAALTRDPAGYASPAVRDWSAFVTAAPAFIVLTPQYNHGYPGELKNAFDQLYWEWHGKPVLVIAYGARGGGRGAAQLKQVLVDGQKMRHTGEVCVTLPEQYIRGEARVNNGEDEFLKVYEEELVTAIRNLVGAIEEKDAST
ncbi:hypothetical protein HWV62_24712 [Athelia sp. TMB]|nr:hypothetical protein HWV62_24712 [Athelia sp. TMB]